VLFLRKKNLLLPWRAQKLLKLEFEERVSRSAETDVMIATKGRLPKEKKEKTS